MTSFNNHLEQHKERMEPALFNDVPFYLLPQRSIQHSAKETQ